MNGESRSTLRRQLRAARRSLSPQQQHQASQQLWRQLAQHPLFRRSRHIAFYLANDGEIDPSVLMAHARRLGKHCYLPVITGWPADRMHFQRLVPGQRWVSNRFGIREPLIDPGLQARPWRLDLILMPLVGFDENGNRLGMGGGFYDRTFAFRRRRQHWTGPRLLGLAHHCQKVAQLPTASWDIPLDGIVSDQQIILLR
ncbi:MULTISPECIES: 5-formyltetrahydrofolate cyclo-ligase [Halopseudomonas]|jgi:5-formyltetrahydrofolate cyclo-ligase|uniref:5-formyltetrahydrofolate cyclo-ligase n=1 Tax=Halopseudomonas bauzanensis TaxID=653930 RepID=A0A031MIS0_9GAMM|nr:MULTISPECIES: 5-formyltetrahydrofolate cyclo-ligase [Halopseudomonas]EZQ19644.1 5-formyltetrahydrofolate cyclo-ligase [Halopseudomonas bauzanensis]TKA93349.1 5-formyltetrahydrofolate cyclo-ligase [Halopseudomonas bauzanensis]WGK61182.1 5-formyltetrahydrofolate cyclo-ligase [Halopseudomonas sp. SMJS2]SER41067.1 5-formyltetrahydrofolate cyclo-ligase [Halopseudomonas bauzanensis]SFL77283.1 5-formyltetrahydrofolate cyclo-ligase [Halopseudomonas bauzanensis]